MGLTQTNGNISHELFEIFSLDDDQRSPTSLQRFVSRKQLLTSINVSLHSKYTPKIEDIC